MKIDWYLAFAWLLVLTVVIMIASYFIINNINSCTAQPLEYAVKQVKSKFEVDMVWGSLFMKNKEGISDSIDFGDLNISKFSSETNFNTSFP